MVLAPNPGDPIEDGPKKKSPLRAMIGLSVAGVLLVGAGLGLSWVLGQRQVSAAPQPEEDGLKYSYGTGKDGLFFHVRDDNSSTRNTLYQVEKGVLCSNFGYTSVDCRPLLDTDIAGLKQVMAASGYKGAVNARFQKTETIALQP